MYVPDRPRFSPTWLASGSPERPAWLTDDRWLPAGERELYARASAGLYATLGRFDHGGTALLPAYVPQAVVRAVLERGYDVAYYPVSAHLSLPADAVASRIEATEPDLALFVDYLGFRDESFPALAERARAAGAIVVEDCARAAFGRDREGDPLGATGDLAIYSLHKTLPVPNGGLVVARDVTPPSPSGTVPERRDVFTSGLVGLMSRLGLPPTAVKGSSKPARSGAEIRDAPTRADDATLVRGPGRATVRGLARCDPDRVQTRRRDAYRSLRRAVADVDGIATLTPPAHDGACPYGVGIRGPDREWRDDFYRRVRRAGLPIEVYQWPPAARGAATAGAQRLRNTACVLPTYRRLPSDGRARLVRILEDSLAD
ncbi:DegT/DnrJ/EryC1/StrS family aminotransferase [Halorientalis halophila]|uniref:DegT/DnrJ/EryC1/StrS family aminotransferase n=1 Tax=Halorientalis halophila TaxID=3108499 RepID=UPI00300A8B6F